MKGKRVGLIGVSVLAHVGLLMLVGLVPVPKVVEQVMVTMRVVEPTPPAPPEPAPTPPTPPTPDPTPAAPKPTPPKPSKAPARPTARPGPAPKAEAAPSAEGSAGVADFGVVLTGGGGPGGVAVAVGDPAGEVGGGGAPVARQAPARRLSEEPSRDKGAACLGETREPRAPSGIRRPRYTQEAILAKVSGRVRVQLEVDARGEVTSAKVVSGLGFGLDEEALEALRGARFSPGLRCGEAVAGRAVIAVRFEL